MKKLFFAVLVTAFLSVAISGCYTRFEAPRPSYGEQTQQYDNGDYYDYYYGNQDYWGYPFYFSYGWHGPYFAGYPYFGYGSFYSPFWYDPWYYYYGYSYSSRDYQKAIRDRDRGGPAYNPPPSSGPTPAPPYRPPSTVKETPPSGSNTSGVSKGTSTKSEPAKGSKDAGKGTRRR